MPEKNGRNSSVIDLSDDEICIMAVLVADHVGKCTKGSPMYNAGCVLMAKLVKSAEERGIFL
jgi:hypothetical protein